MFCQLYIAKKDQFNFNDLYQPILGQSTRNLQIIEEYVFYFIQRCYDNQELDIYLKFNSVKSCIFSISFGVIIIYSPPRKIQLLWGGGDEVIIIDKGKMDLKDTYLSSGIMETESQIENFKIAQPRINSKII